MRKFRTHYDNLQVAENASPEVIKGAYKYLCQKWHPDRHPKDKDRADRNLKIINAAYEVLSNPEKRRRHDEWIRVTAKDYTDGAYDSRSEAKKEPKNKKEDHETEAPPDQSSNSSGGAYHPWRRFCARYIDTIIGGAIATFLTLVTLYAASPQDAGLIDRILTENLLLMGLSFYLSWIPFEAVFLSATGTTPAKWLYGIRVKDAEGNNLSFARALLRSSLAWIQGMAFGLPIAIWFANHFGYKRLTRTGTTLWDTSAGAIVLHKRWGVVRTFAVVIVTALSLLIISAISSAMTDPPYTPYTPYNSSSTGNQFSFRFENKCAHPLMLVIRYQDVDGAWRMEGEWDIDPGEATYLLDRDGARLLTTSAVWYYYAWTTDDSNFEWSGDHQFLYETIELPMIRLEDIEGDSDWATRCD